MADDSHHGEREHDEGDMVVPAMPGAGLVMIEAEFILGSLKTILDSPAMTFHRHLAIGVPLGHQVEKKARSPLAMSADQEASCPFPAKCVVVFAGLEIG